MLLSLPKFSAFYSFKFPKLLLSLNTFLEEVLISKACVYLCVCVHVCASTLVQAQVCVRVHSMYVYTNFKDLQLLEGSP